MPCLETFISLQAATHILGSKPVEFLPYFRHNLTYLYCQTVTTLIKVHFSLSHKSQGLGHTY